MSGQISEDKISEVRERTDIVELISQYVSLKRSGANHMGLCPFHSEKSPSFSVNAARQFFHCFGCGIGGDVFSFLMKIEGLAFPDAVRRLAERAGIELEEQALSPEEEQRRQARERLFRANDLAAGYFHRLLMEDPAGEPARRYMKTRGYGRRAAGEYQIGYARDSWDGLRRYLEQNDIAVEDARTLGLLREGKQQRGDYDLFRGRLIFPIFDLQGRVVAFAGRVLDDSKPKYINSPESPVYHKGRVLFGLYQARQAMRQSGEVILVEGYFDQLALYRAGFAQVVATCGTALTADHARLLKRYVQRVILLFDQDAAGRQATFRAMSVLQEEGVPALVVELPQGDDPDSYLQHHGSDAFREKLSGARSAMDLYMEDRLAEAGNGIEQKARAAEQVVEKMLSLSSELEQDLYLKELSRRSGIELELLKQTRTQLQRRQRQQHRSAVEDPPPPDELPPTPVESGGAIRVREASVAKRGNADRLSRTEETLLTLLVKKLVPADRFRDEGGVELFSHPDARAAAELLLDGGESAGAAQELLERLSAADVAQFGEYGEELFNDCLAALRRQRKKQRREESLEKIRQLEQSGAVEQAKDLLEEFKNLK